MVVFQSFEAAYQAEWSVWATLPSQLSQTQDPRPPPRPKSTAHPLVNLHTAPCGHCRGSTWPSRQWGNRKVKFGGPFSASHSSVSRNNSHLSIVANNFEADGNDAPAWRQSTQVTEFSSRPEIADAFRVSQNIMKWRDDHYVWDDSGKAIPHLL